jgi:endonuclease/exonuclease/phosphatase family metal-dependent hydrolase
MMTYNVHNFKKYGSKNDIPTKHEILQLINDQQPDIISFQEFYTRRKGQFNMRDSLNRILHTRFYCIDSLYFNDSELIGMAIFSKLPILAHGFIRLTDNSINQCLYIDVKKNDKPFRVYNIHLQSIGFDPGDYKYLNNISEKVNPDIHSTRRLGSKLKNAFLKRSEQVAIIKKHAADCPYPYVITGDFNDTPASYAVHQMSKGLKNAFRERGFGFARTYNGPFPNFQIDYIMASPQFDVVNYKIIEKKLSDHYPVRSDLVLK